MKYVLIIVIVLILIGGGVAWWYTRDKEASASAAANAQQTAKVERQTVKVSVQATGAVASNKDVAIKCKASGEILELPYDVSDRVSQGALILRVDTIDEINALKQAEAVVQADQSKLVEAQQAWEIAKLNILTMTQRDQAALASAKAQYADAAAKAERTAELFEQKLDSQEDLDTAKDSAAQANANVQTAEAAIAELDQEKIQIDTKEQDINLAKAQLTQDQVKKDIAQQNVEYCTVTAPMSDIKGDSMVWTVSALGVGVQLHSLVQSGTSNVSGGTAVVTLSDLSHIFVLAEVDESDVGNLMRQFEAGKDLPVHMNADAFPGVDFSGKVVRIATTGVNTSNVVTFEVKIEVTSDNRNLLKPIMTVNADIVSAERPDVLTVPVQAVSPKHADSDDTTQQAAKPDEIAAGDPEGAGTQPAATRPAHNKKKHKDQFALGDSPQPATVDVVKPDGSTETRDVMVGLTDGTMCEVISGLEEGETVVLKKMGANSRWHGAGAAGGNGSGGGRKS